MEKKRLTERLNDKINELEQELFTLQMKAENERYQDRWQWRHIRKLSVKENFKLPLPRLEIRWRVLDDYEAIADYGLVYKHFSGSIEFMPFSSTKTSSRANRKYDAGLELPFRDAAHIWSDMEHLKLPGFVTDESNGKCAKVIGHGETELLK